MKHIISLALKYISRQKQRTLLTFLCVTLSVFILCSFGAYFGSILTTMKNAEMRSFGAWEAEVSEWVNLSSDRNKAMDIIENHAAVDRMLSTRDEYNWNFLERSEEDGSIRYAKFSDGKSERKIQSLYGYAQKGDIKLTGEDDRGVARFDDKYVDNGGVVVPGWFRELGYSVGDTVDFTLTMVTAQYDENSDIIKEIRSEVEAEKGLPIVGDDPVYRTLEGDDRKKAEKKKMYYLLKEKGLSLNEQPFTTVSEGEEYHVSLKISGFNTATAEDELRIHNYGSVEMFLTDFLRANEICGSAEKTYITINKKIDFDDGLESLANDLGFDIADEYQMLNSSLLALEFRSAQAIATLVAYGILAAIPLFLLWAVARFVIDNAFEISAKERSTQYAALRIMGASKGQIAGVVFAEAVFYTLTSVPIGTVLAYVLCSASVKAFSRLGFMDFEFSANPYITVFVIALCIIGIFISAYTSSMWTARKLSPAEALNFGKPKSKKKQPKSHKSKLRLNSKKFISRYTRKNVMRSKSRFLIAAITMAIGVTLFTFTAVVGIVMGIQLKKMDYEVYDYFISYDDNSLMADTGVFRNEEVFSSARIFSSVGYSINSDKEVLRQLNEHIKFDHYGFEPNMYNYVHMAAVDRVDYDEKFAKYAGMSYDELVESGGGLIFSSCYGSSLTWKRDEETGELIEKYERSGKIFDEPLMLRLLDESNVEAKLVGEVCTDYNDYTACVILPIESPACEDYNFDLRIRLMVNGSEHHDEADKIVRDFLDKYPASSSEDNYSFGTGRSDFIFAIVKMVVILILAIWLVGVLSMVNSITTSVLNRSHELMMLRSVGMTRKQLRKTVFQESMMFAAVSSVIGIISAFLLLLMCGYSMIVARYFYVTGTWVLAVVAVVVIALNIGISALAAIPGVRTLARAEALTKTV